MQWNLWGRKHQRNWKYCWEEKPTSFFGAWDIILCSSLIFWYKTWLQNYNLRITSQVLNKKLNNQRTLRYQKIICNYRIIAQKLPILKQGVKTINAESIWTRALSKLPFVQFRPYATSFPRPALTQRLKGLVLNAGYL